MLVSFENTGVSIGNAGGGTKIIGTCICILAFIGIFDQHQYDYTVEPR